MQMDKGEEAMKYVGDIPIADFIMILLFLVLITLMGVWATRKVKSGKDFATAGQELSWFTCTGSCIASAIGANVVIGKYEVILESGVSGIVASWFWWIGWLFLLLLAKPLRDSGAVSIPDFLQMRYGEKTRNIGAVCVMIATISMTAAQFLAIGNILEALGICGRDTGVWVGAVVIVLFTIFSGLWGVAITDTFQSIFLLIAFGVVFPIAVFKVAGGWDVVTASHTAEELSLFRGMAPVTMAGWFFYYIFSTGADPVFAQRVFSAKDTKTAVTSQLAAWTATIVVTGVICALPALAINVIFPDMTIGSQFTPKFLLAYMPPIVRGLMLSFLLSMMLTSGDSQLLTLVSTITEDIIRPKMKEEDAEKRMLLISRLVCMLATVMVCAMALYFGKIYQLLKTGGSAYGAGIFIPLVLGCFWKKADSRAVNIGMLAGLIVSFGFDMFFKIPMGLSLDGIIPGGLLCLMICVGGSLGAAKRNS